MARPASQVSRLGFPVPQPSRPRLDSSFHSSCCNRVPSLISFTNGPVCPGRAGLGQGQKGSVSAKGVTSLPSQLPGASLEIPSQRTRSLEAGLLSWGRGP